MPALLPACQPCTHIHSHVDASNTPPSVLTCQLLTKQLVLVGGSMTRPGKKRKAMHAMTLRDFSNLAGLHLVDALRQLEKAVRQIVGARAGGVEGRIANGPSYLEGGGFGNQSWRGVR